MILLIDNYDSFTYNLVQRLGEIDPAIQMQVVRNDAATVDEIVAMKPERVIISPGPCTPAEAGISRDVVRRLFATTPILGVCLGHQCMGDVFGGAVVRNDRIMHGKTSLIHHDGKGVFRGMSNPFEAARYHSLVIRRDSIPPELEVTAWTDEGEVMGVRHRERPTEGVQFHPESFMTPEGHTLLAELYRSMISVREALDLVVGNAGRQESWRVTLDEAVGRVLAEDVQADADSPPFDKSMMDGFAVRAADVNAKRPLRIVGEIRAGSTELPTINEGETAAIMTGAPIPPGADAVVVVERCRVEDGLMTTDLESAKDGSNILIRGFEFRQGHTVLTAGRPLMPAEVGVLATVGRKFVEVYKRPRVGVLASGDELVPVGGALGPGQIRDSNTPTLLALLEAAGAEPFSVGVTPDQPNEIERRIKQGLGFDVLLLTGGVSMGAADFIPQTLAKLGVKQVFHKVALKPGVPVWFGTHEKGLVFGLPGNPVSVLACFELFVTTALRARQGWADPLPRFFNARLQADFTYPTKRETYHPARLNFTDDGPVIAPVPWFGSADVLGASRADALVVLPVGPGEHKAGDRLRVLPLSKPGWVWACGGAGGAS